MANRGRNAHARLLAGAAMLALLGAGGAVQAQETAKFNIAPQPLASALNEFAVQSPWPILYTTTMTGGKATRGVTGAANAEIALNTLLEGTGLTWRRDGDTFLIVQGGSADPQGASAAGGGAEVEALIVTAQKREENIQDVPIAISAFTQKDLDEQKIEGGFDLLKAIPNVTFSKNNFSSYNFSIRGIGTKAVSVTTDPGVAVAFNNTPLIRNRLFEQEYFDLERVEVLRGPQGTLYGRNATAGVINVISAKPDLGDFDGWIKGEVGNYHTKRLSAMVNVPLVEDKLAVRLAGALTSRDGYDFNSVTGNPINGRDLWSARLTVGFEPTERLRGNFIWERFEEDDDRSRTGKQLCHRDPGPAEIDGIELQESEAGKLSQGCKPGSLYDDAAFGAPNGYSIPFIQLLANGLDISFGVTPLYNVDPYGGLMQSRDLRTVASVHDPRYQARADVFELNLEFDLTPALTLASQTAYNEDQLYSFQDYNRFNSLPLFRDTSDPTSRPGYPFNVGWECAGRTTLGECVDWSDFAPGGVFTDPQIGPSDTVAGFDISQAKSEQFSQEFRVSSAFDGPVNFNVGANYLKYETLEDYYVMFNMITAVAHILNGSPDSRYCENPNLFLLFYTTYGIKNPIDSHGCIYIDPNPVDFITGEGHNYFRSKNPYQLESKSAFGEVYVELAEDLKMTAGLRYTDDRKVATPVPSQLLLSNNPWHGGTVTRGYPAEPDIKQQWQEWSGRLGVDWKPSLGFTDDTMLYAFYSRGYKGGGANPPEIGFATEPANLCEIPGVPERFGSVCDPGPWTPAPLQISLRSFPDTFEPEFVNAYEVGAKNILMGGALVLNLGAFFYDYSNYQVSQIKQRTAVNENFDAEVWGVEVESVFSPSRNLRFNAALGYQDTEIADGETSIDLMNRTQGNPDWIVVKPWIQVPSNCIAPLDLISAKPQGSVGLTSRICPGHWESDLGYGGQILDRSTWPNEGQGFDADLGGNELPNAPHWTVSLGAQYGVDMFGSWRATVRGDAYWQSQSWHRVYNLDPYDKLHGWYNANLSLWVEHPDNGLKFELYAKNILNDTPITDAFLNSDDSGLTTNVFVLDPRLIGLSIRKEF